MRRVSGIMGAVFAAILVWGCMDYGPRYEEEFSMPGNGLFITNEGNFMYGNATLSYYDIESGDVENEVFVRTNAAKLGDVAQSVVIYDDKGYIVVNNSGVIFEIDIDTFKVTGMITGLTSPRYIHFVNDTKAYVTDLNDARITIINPQTRQITGHIDMGDHPSTEQMVQYDKWLFVNCWSYDNKILVVDTERDEMVDEIEVGLQPIELVLDVNGKLWTITDGGYEGSPYGYESPALYRIDAATRTVEHCFSFGTDDVPSALELNGAGDMLYFVNGAVWRMDVTDSELPDEPFVEDRQTKYYGLGIDPVTGEIYVADAVDYQQPGKIYRYSAEGELQDSFTVGVSPGEFCFKY